MIALTIEESAGITRRREPIKIGMPFPKGILQQYNQLEIKNPSDKTLPFQATPLAHWSDGSIQWALLEFFVQADPNSKVRYHVDVLKAPALLSDRDKKKIIINEKDKTITISTGEATFEISQGVFKPFQNVFAEGKRLLPEGGTKLRLIDSKGTRWIPVPKTFRWIAKGPIRVCLRIDGHFSSDGKQTSVLFTALLDFWAGSSFCSLTFQIHNPRTALHPGGLWDLGDPGSIYFRDLSLMIPLEDPLASVRVSTEIGKRVRSFAQSDMLLYQDSSGGDQWDSPNHIDSHGKLTVSFQGYKLWSIDPNGKKLIKEGKRANPYFKVNASEGCVSGGILDFWQNFPKALSVKSNFFRISLFPQESPGLFELQGGERKTHTIFLDFGLYSNNTIIPQFMSPLKVSIDPIWVKKTKAFPYLVPELEDPNHAYLDYIKRVIEGPDSFFTKREVIDEYGWRNFGDLYADHEAVNHKGLHPFISHYNNQYDFIYGAAAHFLRSSDKRWYDLMVQAAKHTMDIDIYHTDKDKSAYNHGLFWHTDHYREAGRATHRTFTRDGLNKKQTSQYGGGPCNEHNYTSGLLQYYYLTGDIFAREAVLELASWILDMDNGSNAIWAIIDDGPTGLASQTVSSDYHGPGRGAGNSINALMDAYRLTGHRPYMSKAEELIQRCIHPSDNIDKLCLDDPEYRWSYLVFLQVLGKYLDLKSELVEIDWYFFYARDSLLHYAHWMMEHEVPYKEVLHKVEIPTETWPAQDVRKSCVLNYACKYGPPELKESFKRKARFFFDRCLKDVLSFKTAYLTRPMVLLTVYGFMQAYFDLNQGKSFQYLDHNYKFGSPTPFMPQRARLKNSFKRKVQAVLYALRYIAKLKYYSIKRRLFGK